MPTVQFTSNLNRFYPDLKELEIEANTIAQLVEQIDKLFPGLKGYLVTDQNSLRDHVNIFINDNMVKDRHKLEDQIGQHDKVFVMQALSGG